MKHLNCKVPIITAYLILVLPGNLYALQFHSGSEGIITHQIGHLFFMYKGLSCLVDEQKADQGQENP